MTTVKYLSDHRKHRYELIEEPQKQPNRIFICKELAAKVIVNCRITETHNFRTRLGFKQYYVILTKGHSVHSDGNIGCEIKLQKAIEKELDCEFISFDHDKEDFDIFKAISEIFRCIKQSSNR